MNLEDWIGRSEERRDLVTAAPVAALAATLDRDPALPPPGTPLPPLWHWLYFLPLPKRSEIGPDGHAKRGSFLPPVPLPRRMWAGSQFAFHAPLCVGDTIVRRSTIADVREKQGRSGPLVFVKLRHEIRREGEAAIALTEHHDIVYRQAPRAGAEEPPPIKASDNAAWEKEWVPDDVLLFRYSALTFNGHRIHYDRRYVTEVEGYPGLVVHGPLVATLLLELLRERMTAARVSAYEFKALRPLFDRAPFTVCGKPEPDGSTVRLWAMDHAGNLAMAATATLATP